ncbi:MAG: FKBP-type peptidyl-prolyl cis-trans isomerase [Bacteroidales bacterium]|jgi:FKBP-type peptidyl-prolyl cis-trans isomerase FkpA|nr:FKBP-type peptidyl-prolyl cis-trans isomerase [Bacteroidales bacterium]MDD3756158.1 FKBP-type peptidyl-prolyl cis-trans isomerase [Bacteroidales bacterium]MDY0401413.1 FKBP-type peptidyl-prolyl cis-trans isomerase [Bacteroidales bacterium]
MNFSRILILLFIIFSFQSCECNRKNKDNSSIDNIDVRQYEESLLEANKLYLEQEHRDISAYIHRKGWQMDTTPRGVYYMIYYRGDGYIPERGDIVRFAFKTMLINDQVCYDSEIDGPKEVELGKADIESGLEEVLYYLPEGTKAYVIIPSHLAFGWLGDVERIPSRAVLIYDLHILKVIKR